MQGPRCASPFNLLSIDNSLPIVSFFIFLQVEMAATSSNACQSYRKITLALVGKFSDSVQPDFFRCSVSQCVLHVGSLLMHIRGSAPLTCMMQGLGMVHVIPANRLLYFISKAIAFFPCMMRLRSTDSYEVVYW